MLWKKAGQSVSAVDRASQMQMSVSFFKMGSSGLMKVLSEPQQNI